MTLKIAERWFERRQIDDDITLLWEPFVDPLMRCNIWHVRGRERDLLVDTGLGVASLRQAAADLFGNRVTAFATHTHADHAGGMHEFEERAVHRAEAHVLSAPGDDMSLRVDANDPAYVDYLAEVGYRFESELLITALPRAGYDIDTWHVPAAAPTLVLEAGDIVDLGDRAFEVLHLPGHSPGSAGLWEAATGTLFSGDAIYDGPLLDRLSDSHLPDYLATMERLAALPVSVVHAGHDPSFGRERLKEIATRFIENGGYRPE